MFGHWSLYRFLSNTTGSFSDDRAAGFEEEGDADSLEIRYGEDGVTRSQVEVWA